MSTQYKRGQKWRVMVDNARLSGMKSNGPYAQSGWRMDVPKGTVLTCLGEQWTAGDGVPVVQWADEHGNFLASDCTFSPAIGTMWNRTPAPGSLFPKSDAVDNWTMMNGSITDRMLFEEDVKASWNDPALAEDVARLLERAKDLKGRWIIWDPEGDGEGYLRADNNPFTLAEQAMVDHHDDFAHLL